MSIKSKPPQEDPQTKARREQAEARAEERQIDGIRDGVSRETDAIVRRFGVRAALAGAPSLGRSGFGGIFGPSGVRPGGGGRIISPTGGGRGEGFGRVLR